MTFTLLKSGVPVNEQQAEKEASFFLPSVSIINAGSYSCFYSDKMDPKKKSVASDALDLVATGKKMRPLRDSGFKSTPSFPNISDPIESVRVQDAGLYTCIYYENSVPKASEPSESLNICLTDFLTKPSLTVQPNSNVSLGGNMSFHCQTSACGTRFTLYKEGEVIAVGIVNSTQNKVEFLINPVTKNHSGSYKCHYHTGGHNSIPSMFSDPLELLVTGFLTKPSLTVRPSANVSLGGNVTFYCQTSACGTRFTLHKEGEERPVGTVDSSQNEAEFLISAVSKNHTGSYRCHHHTGGSNSTPSMFSDALEVLVTGEEALLGRAIEWGNGMWEQCERRPRNVCNV
ncbi:immunoglobulin superfamily member 1-like [Macrotis lagotis]|uniref:immunoglobulin superfamily member 1-like n=1 Tax=Macrotis lagotis TaxID=92651 RepID=UPI003D69527F